MATYISKPLILFCLTGLSLILLSGCGTGAVTVDGEEQALTAEDAAKLFKSTQQALLGTALGAKGNSQRNAKSKSLIELPLSFDFDCPTSGSLYCDGTAAADLDGAELDFTAGANSCIVFDGISIDGTVDFSLIAEFAGLYVEGSVSGSFTFDMNMGEPISCDMDLEMYVDANLEPNFSGTFCGFEVDILNDLIAQLI